MWDDVAKGVGVKQSYIPVESTVYRIVIYYFVKNTALFGIEFFDVNG